MVFVELPLYLFLLVKNVNLFICVYLFICEFELPCFDCITWLYTESAWQHIHRFPPFPDAGFWLFNRATCQNEKLPLGLNQKNTKK